MRLFFFCFLLINIAEVLLAASNFPLAESRKKHKTQLVKKIKSQEKLDLPQNKLFKVVQYPTSIGDMSAYLSQHDNRVEKRPAIIWLTGGFPSSSPGKYLWEETSIDNEQSARVYRQMGIVMMFPTLRGCVASNPGVQEVFYGEVDDVISAYHYLSKQPNIDKKRIYLGGHSTGGTLALLVAASCDYFAGVISLGPVADDYGKEYAHYAWNKKERALRAPIHYINTIKTPTYIIEGEDGNIMSLKQLELINKNKVVFTQTVSQSDHFKLIHTVNKIFAKAILKSKDGKLHISLKDIKESHVKRMIRQREVIDLQILTEIRREDVDLSQQQTLSYTILGNQYSIKLAKKEFIQKGFKAGKLEKHQDDDGSSYHSIDFNKDLTLNDLKSIFKYSKAAYNISKKHNLYYNYWDIQTR